MIEIQTLKYGKLIVFLLLCFCAGVWGRGPEDLEENPAVQRFRTYLRIRTVQPEPDYLSAINFLLGQAKEIGLSTRTFEFVPKKPILLTTWKGSSKEKLQSVILNSHMDVVPVEEEKWKYPPFDAEMDEDGNIFARGSQDMKVVGIMYLEAIRILKSKGWVPVRDVHVLWVPDEEVGGDDGWGKFSVSKEFEELNASIVLDEGSISSSGDKYIAINGEKNMWWLVITAKGETGHGSIYFENSAAENMFKSIASINAFRDSQMALVRAGEKSSEEVVSVNSVFLKSGLPTSDGFTMNIQPSVVEAGFDVRIPPSKEMAALMKKRVVEEWAPKNRNMSFYFTSQSETRDGEVPLTTADDSNPWWFLLRTAVSKFNATLTPRITGGATDSSFVRMHGVDAFGITAIQNVPSLLHNHNEYMNGYEFLKGINVVVEIIDRFGSFSGSRQSYQIQRSSM
ncbi:hypothetical protein R1sor_007400 [Riccia sorocarpa]|uniref:Peptidase M20 dimerisation domain-containing protein n=1 Tax=Riccia sorocarpa TaxID=122646 RepID=A0ABD3HTT3_9MARC